MKKIFLLLFMMLGFCAKAQSVNNTPLNELDVEYIKIVESGKMLSNKLTIQLDYGQPTKYLGSGKETIITDENGKSMEFNSMIDALNFLSKYGFEFVQAYGNAAEDHNVYYYILRKKQELKSNS